MVLGQEVGVHGVLRRRRVLRLRGQWSWLRMLLLDMLVMLLLVEVVMRLRRVLM